MTENSDTKIQKSEDIPQIEEKVPFYTKVRYSGTFIVLCVSLFVVSIISLSIGHYSYNPMDVLTSIWNAITGQPSADPSMDMVIVNIRLPRILAAIIIGGSLSLAGAVYQGVFRNPLVSPDLLGVSNGACVGAAIAILCGATMVTQQVSAFVFGLVAVGLSVTIPRLVGNRSNLMLVLSGIIISGFFSSMMALIKFSAKEESQLPSIVYWQMGSLTTVSYKELAFVFPLVLVCIIVLIALAWRLNILSFGEVEAKTLGMKVTRVRGVVIACASALTACTVCISGTIGWIGLIIPHLSRLLVGSDHRRQLPVTLLLGAVFLLVIDTLCRTITSQDIPLSVLTGLIGAPFYAWLLWKQKAANLS